MNVSDATIWTVIVLLGIGTFAMRLSFLALIGRKPLPEWLLRLLRYTPVAVIPGLMAPQIFMPAGGAPQPALLASIAATLAVGVWRKNAIWAMLAGAVVLIALTLAGL